MSQFTLSPLVVLVLFASVILFSGCGARSQMLDEIQRERAALQQDLNDIQSKLFALQRERSEIAGTLSQVQKTKLELLQLMDETKLAREKLVAESRTLRVERLIVGREG